MRKGFLFNLVTIILMILAGAIWGLLSPWIPNAIFGMGFAAIVVLVMGLRYQGDEDNEETTNGGEGKEK